jgi:hypothetical protein
MYLVPKIVYDALNNQKDKINDARDNLAPDGTSTINIRQLNNLDVNNGGRVTIQNDDHFTGPQKSLSTIEGVSNGNEPTVISNVKEQMLPSTDGFPLITDSSTTLTHTTDDLNATLNATKGSNSYDDYQQQKYLNSTSEFDRREKNLPPKKRFRSLSTSSVAENSFNLSSDDDPQPSTSTSVFGDGEINSVSENLLSDAAAPNPNLLSLGNANKNPQKRVGNAILSQAQIVTPERFMVRPAKPIPPPSRIIEERTPIAEVNETSDQSQFTQESEKENAFVSALPNLKDLTHRRLPTKSSIKSCWVSRNDSSAVQKLLPKQVQFAEVLKRNPKPLTTAEILGRNSKNAEVLLKKAKPLMSTSAVEEGSAKKFNPLKKSILGEVVAKPSIINTPAMNEVIAKRSNLKKVNKANIAAAMDRVIARVDNANVNAKKAVAADINSVMDKRTKREVDIATAMDRVIARKIGSNRPGVTRMNLKRPLEADIPTVTTKNAKKAQAANLKPVTRKKNVRKAIRKKKSDAVDKMTIIKVPEDIEMDTRGKPQKRLHDTDADSVLEVVPTKKSRRVNVKKKPIKKRVKSTPVYRKYEQPFQLIEQPVQVANSNVVAERKKSRKRSLEKDVVFLSKNKEPQEKKRLLEKTPLTVGKKKRVKSTPVYRKYEQPFQLIEQPVQVTNSKNNRKRQYEEDKVLLGKLKEPLGKKRRTGEITETNKKKNKQIWLQHYS